MEVWIFRLLVVAAVGAVRAADAGALSAARPRPGRLSTPPTSAPRVAHLRQRDRLPEPDHPRRARSSASRTSSCSGASARSPATRRSRRCAASASSTSPAPRAFHAYELALVPFSRRRARPASSLLAIRRGVLRPRALGADVSEGVAPHQRLHRDADDHVPGRRGRRARRAASVAGVPLERGQLVGAHAGHPGLHGADPRLEAPAPAAVAGDGVPARADARHGAEARFREGADRPRDGGAAREEAGARCVHLRRVRPLPGELSGVRHRQGAQPEEADPAERRGAAGGEARAAAEGPLRRPARCGSARPAAPARTSARSASSTCR